MVASWDCFWEADSHSDGQEIPFHLWNLKFDWSLLFDTVLNQLNCNTHTQFFNIHFCLASPNFRTQIWYAFLSLPQELLHNILLCHGLYSAFSAKILYGFLIFFSLVIQIILVKGTEAHHNVTSSFYYCLSWVQIFILALCSQVCSPLIKSNR